MYPINLLRNVAVNGPITKYVVLCDMEFLPSDHAEERLNVYKVQMITHQVLVMHAVYNL